MHRESSILDLIPGESGIIKRFKSSDSAFSRLRELGMCCGTPLRLVKYAPFGDPIQIKVRGFYLSIDKNTAKDVVIEKNSDEL